MDTMSEINMSLISGTLQNNQRGMNEGQLKWEWNNNDKNSDGWSKSSGTRRPTIGEMAVKTCGLTDFIYWKLLFFVAKWPFDGNGERVADKRFVKYGGYPVRRRPSLMIDAAVAAIPALYCLLWVNALSSDHLRLLMRKTTATSAKNMHICWCGENAIHLIWKLWLRGMV